MRIKKSWTKQKSLLYIRIYSCLYVLNKTDDFIIHAIGPTEVCVDAWKVVANYAQLKDRKAYLQVCRGASFDNHSKSFKAMQWIF